MTRHIEMDLGEDEILGLMKGLQYSITIQNSLSRLQREHIWIILKDSLPEPYKNELPREYADYWDESR